MTWDMLHPPYAMLNLPDTIKEFVAGKKLIPISIRSKSLNGLATSQRNLRKRVFLL